MLIVVLRLLVTDNVVPSSPILVTMMMEAIHSCETSVFTRVTRRNVPEDDLLHSHRRDYLKSYICVLFQQDDVRYQRPHLHAGDV
jgi:hypothetical protein